MSVRTITSAALVGACSLAFMSSAQAIPGPNDPLLYDNGVIPNTGLSSQNDTAYPFESAVADDFGLGNPFGGAQIEITGISFTGLQFNDPPDVNNPGTFNIFFYADAAGAPVYTGDGTSSPAGDALFSFTEVILAPEAAPGPYSYGADFAGSAVLDPNTTYWVSVQFEGFFPPQWGWQGDNASGGNSVQGFPLLGTPFWTTLSPGTEMDFQLYGRENIPSVPAPGTAFLLLAGMAGLVVRRRRSS